MTTTTGPNPADVDALRELLEASSNFRDDDQRARYLLSSDLLAGHRQQQGEPVTINDLTLPGVEGVERVYFDNTHEPLSKQYAVGVHRTVVVSLGVDSGEFHGVEVASQQVSDLATLRQAIAVLTHTHDHLAAVYGERAPVGRCPYFGEWGQCVEPEGHLPGEHRSVTREQALALPPVLSEVEGATR